MLLQSRETHDCYEQILALVKAAGRLRASVIKEKLPNVKAAAVAARLTRMERAGYLVRLRTLRSCDGGREFAVGPVSLPPFDDSEARTVYENMRACYAILVKSGPAGMTAGVLHARMNESRPLAVTCNRLMVWEAAGRVACTRSRRPNVWRALADAYPTFDELVSAETARRAVQIVPDAARAAAVQACATKRLIASMVVAPWLWGLLPDDQPPSEIMSQPMIPACGGGSTSEGALCL